MKTKELFLILTLLTSIGVFGLETNYFNEKTYSHPKREISIISSSTGYNPKRPTVFVSEKIKVFVTSLTDRPGCMIVKNQDFYLEAKKGEMSEGELFFTKSGVHEFYCPANGHKGKIVVLENPDKKKARLRREMASEKKKRVKIWRPRDE